MDRMVKGDILVNIGGIRVWGEKGVLYEDLGEILVKGEKGAGRNIGEGREGCREKYW
jgi:hypothetical protein